VRSKNLVRPERFELPTYCSGGNRSIHLSYGRLTSVYMGRLGSINVRIAQVFENAAANSRRAFARNILGDV
jgi:hypothetical protein